MRSITLITKTKITNDFISTPLLNEFHNKQVIQNDSKELFLGKAPDEFYIYYDDSNCMSDPDNTFEQKHFDKIKFENPQCNDIYFRKYTLIVRVLKIILSLYPELMIYDDEEDEVYSAEEYINKKEN